MSAKTSKEVTDRQKSGQFLITALLLQGGRVSDRLQELVLPSLNEDDPEPQFFSTILALARRLETSLDRLVAVDESVYVLDAHLGDLRAQRKELFSDLARKVARLRLTLINQYVAPGLDGLGFEAETARSPIPLRRQVDRITQAFLDPELDQHLGEPVFSQPIDLRPQAADLTPIAARLGQTLERIDQALRERDQAQIDKNAVMDQHDQIFLRTARAFEDFCRMAGETELAERVRPSVRRPGRTEREPEESEQRGQLPVDLLRPQSVHRIQSRRPPSRVTVARRSHACTAARTRRRER